MFENLEEAFQQLDKKPYENFATSLALYRNALLAQGFTRREAMKLVEGFSKWVYELSFETAMQKREEEAALEEFLAEEEDSEDDS